MMYKSVDLGKLGTVGFRDVDLVQRIGVATAREVRATGAHYTFAPCVAPARKMRRYTVRKEKAMKIFPRPTAGPLCPITRGQTVKYNMKAMGIPKKFAPTIGIAVDHRHKNRSLEGLQANALSPEEFAAATQAPSSYMRVVAETPTVGLVKPTEDIKAFNAYAKLRIEMVNKKHFGARTKRVAEAEKEEKK
ncbi:hypothetical protein IFM89_021117 [Coptis chinensis]|uniref:60S ribosomal protein L13 n=1 Tax=Coptis chinensis TaxID=261450 RepID=A0A835HL60_9MAGN|nr:hypothetical protein IFM89_021117 [Coptis chinensis]